MTLHIDPLGAAGLNFFSKISASISHEIKNCLAVINETAGYLEDVTLMAQKGLPLDPEKLASLAATTLKQVRRADGIVKNMNRLAHSLDEDRRQVDVSEVITLMAAVSERTVVTKGFRLTASGPGPSIFVTTRPFFLQNLIWLMVNFAMSVCGEAKTIGLTAAQAGEVTTIRFSGLDRLTDAAFQDFLLQGGELMQNALNVTFKTEPGKGEIAIALPKGLSTRA